MSLGCNGVASLESAALMAAPVQSSVPLSIPNNTRNSLTRQQLGGEIEPQLRIPMYHGDMPRVQISSGTNTIDSVTPVRLPNGKYRIQWKIRLHDGRLLSRDTTGSTKGEARARAHAKAVELLAQGGTGGSWKGSSRATEYLEKVSKPIVTNSSKLSTNSKARYKTVLGYLTTSFEGYTIAAVSRRRTIEEIIKKIAAEHGAESGRHAKGVASRYFFEELVKDDVIEYNPLAGARIDLGNVKKRVRPEGGRALTGEEYDRVLAYLLALNPAEGVKPPKQGSRTLADRIAVRRCCIDLTLLQMATGLRLSEARTLQWDDVIVDDDGNAGCVIRVENSKTHKERVAALLEPDVLDHLQARCESVGGLYVVGAPLNPDTVWDRSNAQHALKKFYAELARECEVPLLTEYRTHVWRTTLNTLYRADVDPLLRARTLGHTVEVNAARYSDLSDLTSLHKAARARREER